MSVYTDNAVTLLLSACHETEISIEPDSVPPEGRLNIGVVGSGPAGMSFAYTAATIGHHVTLFEKSNEIGGTKAGSVPLCNKPPRLPFVLTWFLLLFFL